MIVEDPLNGIQFGGIAMQDGVVFGGEVVLQSVTLNCRLELLEQLETVLDGFTLVEVGVDEGLQLCVQLANGDVEADVVLIELGVA